MKKALTFALSLSVLAVAASAHATAEHDQPQSPVNVNVSPQAAAGAVAGAYAGQSQSQHTNVDNSNSGMVNNYRQSASTAYAPPVYANGSCMGGTSVGAGGRAFGFSFGKTSIDPNCDTRANSDNLDAKGERGTAIEIMCDIPQVYHARARAGKPCATVSADPDSKIYTEDDPIVRYRHGMQPIRDKEGIHTIRGVK